MFPSPVPPSTATVQTASQILWSNGIAFTGWLLIGTALPTNSQGTYATINLFGMQPPQAIPTWCMIPIVEGYISNQVNIFFTNQVEPPNTKYVFYWLDSTYAQIYPAVGTPPALVTVTTNPYTISVPTLTIPTAPVAVPSPQGLATTPNTGVQVNYATPSRETMVGFVNGINTVFTMSRVPLVCIPVIDGQIQDPSSFTQTGNSVTFTTPPTTGASVTAWLF